MILSAQTIKDLCIEKKMVYPFNERTVDKGMTYGLSPAGYDVRLDLVDCKAISLSRGYHDVMNVFQPNGAFRLASTIEAFRMPDDIIGFVHDKSSWARKGLAVQNTVIEPGWCGHLTLELTYHGNEDNIILERGMPIAQIIFQRLDKPTNQPYDGKYQFQKRGPQEAIEE